MRGITTLPVLCIAAIFAASQVPAEVKAAGKAIELSPEDRAAIEQYLGKDVVGKAVPSNPIADASKFFAFKDGAWIFRFASGDKKGKTQEQSFKALKRDKAGLTGRYANGPKDVLFLRKTDDGNISVVSEQDLNEGVISRFSPPEPIYVSDMKPGDSKKTKIDVEVYDLSHPDHLTHSGSLDVTYSHLGAYKVTVPAGTYDAALIKWDYKGKVGPASIEDLQYRFMAAGVGVVAMVEKKNISAMLVYHDHSKYGKVLMENK